MINWQYEINIKTGKDIIMDSIKKEKKQSKEQEMTERKKLILQMLSEGRRISLAEIMDRWSVVTGKPPLNSKGTIAADIKKLRDEGYNIDSSRSGYLLIKDENVMTADIPDDYVLPDKDVFNEWFIMHILQQRYDQYISLDKLKQDIDNWFVDFEMSDNMLRKCLDRLEQLQYIEVSGKNELGTVVSLTDREWTNGLEYAPDDKEFYHLLESAPILSLINEDDLFKCYENFEYKGSSTELADELEILNDKILQVLPDIDPMTADLLRTAGRKNHIPGEMKEKLEEFLKLPFKTEELMISYPFVEGEKEIRFMTGIIVYSLEKNELYLVGESEEKLQLLRFDRIIEVKPGECRKNEVFLSEKYMKMFEESWSVPAEEEDDVEIRFQNVSSVRGFAEDLEEARNKTANVVYPEEKDKDSWIIYTDKIKGINDLLPHIRSYGSSAVIIKPERIRKGMIDKTAELIEKYKEVLK